MAWICEQHENINAEGTKVTVTDEEHLNQVRDLNAYFKIETGGFENGKHYFEFNFDLQSGSAFVGVTKENCFSPGNSLRALMYGGYLSDGGGLLVDCFGEPIVSQDKVGILLDLTENHLKMYVFHNDHPLGLAFHIAKPYPKPLFPVVSIGGPGSASITFPEKIPTTIDRTCICYTGIEGDWRIERCEKSGDLISNFTDTWKRFTLKVLKSGSRMYRTPNDETAEEKDSFDLLFHLGNLMFYSMKKQNGKWNVESTGIACGVLKAAIVRDAINAEMFLSEFFENFLDFSVNDDKLVLIANTEMIMILKRIVPIAPEPYTGNPCE
ncbi:hypothetical protein B4U79_16510 [Dinothrombium tinctorium]|uniref:B30.2/SPRY domain-containing protein n=1 Tax=Dinothrombium tinctorium TaxID=1965070 RepID=A0A3S3Q0B8_9ACAR|nr:hypothetical protein B4U79_16777 [Dinothrombium tinctorium]RWS02360.1 hypothetical protein B4U79_16626 [Dinothrombium tinctorium]RWS03446.1 hypothetical protein B4U79_16510 [Dinothrombium tinctorium]